MRPRRFQPWAEQVLAQSPAVTAVEPIEPGPGDGLFMTRVQLTTGAQIIIQWTGSAPPGGDHPDNDEKIVEGDPPAPVEVPPLATSGRLRLLDIEAHLAAILNNGGHKELVQVTGYHAEPDPRLEQRALRYGIRIKCHSGGGVTGILAHTLPPGAKPSPDTRFKQREEV